MSDSAELPACSRQRPSGGSPESSSPTSSFFSTPPCSPSPCHLRASLGGTFAGQQWAVNGYTVAFAASLLTGGAVSDRYGAARVFRLGVTGFGVISLMCAFAPDLGLLIVLRALLGLMGALCLGSSLGLIAQLYTAPAERRGHGGVGRAHRYRARGRSAARRTAGVVRLARDLPRQPAARRGEPHRRRRPGLRRGSGQGRWGVSLACAFLRLLAATIIEASVLAASLALVALAALVWLERRAPAHTLPGGLLRTSWTGLLTGGMVNFAFSGALFVITLLLQGGGNSHRWRRGWRSCP